MKKVTGILSIFFVLLMIINLANVNAMGEDANDVLVSIKAKINEGTNELKTVQSNDNAISYIEDSEGNIYGPEDFCFSDDKVHILDTSGKKVLSFENGKIVNSFSYSDEKLNITKIASNKDSLFMLDTKNNIIVEYDSSNNILKKQINESLVASVIDFKAINDNLYITLAEGKNGRTYKINNIESELLGIIDSFEGRIFDENTHYKTQLIPEEGKDIGHSCKVTIEDVTKNEINEVTLNSKHWIVGAQYLGKDKNNNIIIKLIEMSEDTNYYTIVEETIRTIDADGNTIGISVVVDEHKDIVNDIKSYGENLYKIYNLKDKIEIRIEKSPYTSNYTSNLKSIAQAKEIKNDNIFKASSISRSTIMRNAKKYHSSFSWMCTDKNLKPLTNWQKPRYVSSAGSYKYMPYCWGGFNTPSQYKSGMTAGGRVGNINTSTSGHVYNTYGVDCSGYVSRCWGLTSKHSTRTLPNVATVISKSSLKIGDALNKAGSHVVLYEKMDSYGSYVLYEATKLNGYDKVSHTTRSASNLSAYKALKYKNVQ
ncbi:hypothetical protein PV797_05935 [Clostridiaceae bacterium M8S5]|nr:hypothetical protein PV797_05935 [Clostridiaceae bacterium M8S5]